MRLEENALIRKDREMTNDKTKIEEKPVTKEIEVAVPYLNCRKAPGLFSKFASAAPLKKGTILTHYGVENASDGSAWYKILIGDETAYVHSDYVKPIFSK